MRTLPAAEGFPYGTASAACYLCAGGAGGDGTNTVIIDTEVNIEMEGFLMFCEGCADQVASLLGSTSATETKRQLGRIRNLEDTILRLEREKDEIRDRLLAVVV